MERPIALDSQTRAVIDRIAAQESSPLSALSPAEGRRVHAERLRWVQGDPAFGTKIAKFRDGLMLADHLDRPVVLLHSDRDVAWAEREVPDAKLSDVAGWGG